MAYDRDDRHERYDRPYGRDRERGRDVPDSYAQDRHMRAWLRDEDDRTRQRGDHERDEDRYGARRPYAGRTYGTEFDRDEYRRPHAGRERERDERGFFDRAGDEISSWFGDEDAERRRQQDLRGRRQAHDEDRHRRERSYRPMDWTASDRDYRGGEPYGEPSYGRSGYASGFDRDRVGRGSEWDRDDYRRTSFAGSTAGSNRDDADYIEWRRVEMANLDRDYDEYRRENAARFENDFGQWRQQRQQKRGLLGRIEEHAEVVGQDGEHVGTVDCVRGDRVILTKSDPESGGIHHSIGCTMIDRVEDGKVILDTDAEQAKQRWQDEGREGAMFRDEEGPHILNRSFAGTYR